MSNFGQYLKELREGKHIAQQALADVLGVSVQFVGHIEKGRTNVPRRERIDLLADGLKCTSHERFRLQELGLLGRAKADELEYINDLRKDNQELREKVYLLNANNDLDTSTQKIISSTKIPVVSRVAASLSDDIVDYDPIEFEYMEFKSCKALEVTSDSMSPLAFQGQHVIFSEEEPLVDGCLAFVKLLDGQTLFKRYHERGDSVLLTSINPTVIQAPILAKKEDIEFAYRVVGVRF